MADYATEEEQIEALKRWWRDNGRSIVIGVILGISALAGWRGWAWYEESQSLAASTVYNRMSTQIENGSRADITSAAEQLRDEYANTAYAALGALAAARAAIDDGDAAAAAEWLRWSMENADYARLGYLARERLARVQSERGNHEEALALLEVEYPAAWTAIYAEIRGDILSDQGRGEAAAEAYRTALDAEVPPGDPEAVERKLNQVRTTAGSGSDDPGEEAS